MASRWFRVDPTALMADKVQSRPGVYVVYLNEKVAYVGSTRNLRSRLGSYKMRLGYGVSFLTPWGPCRHVSVKAAYSSRYGDWLMRELRLIRRLSPPNNKTGRGVLNRRVVGVRAPRNTDEWMATNTQPIP